MRDIMSRVEIVTVYNNKELYCQMKESALNSAGQIGVDFVGIDNTGDKYSSAAQAYNYALSNICQSDVLIFCHQDIIFGEGDIKKIVDLCSNNDIALWGVAGVKHINGLMNRHISIVSSIKEGNGNHFVSLSQPSDIQDVFTLDECLIAARKELFNYVKFDEKCCDGWHLYAADLSMQCHSNGIKVNSFYSEITHISSGVVDSEFHRIEYNLARKWKSYKIINYTCGWTYTNLFLFWALYIYRVVKHFLQGEKY